MGGLLILLYGVACYGFFFATFCYMAAWLGNIYVPVSIDSGIQGDLVTALLIDTGLIALFGIHHSVAARPAFKEKLNRIIPEAMERSTYVLVSSLILALLFHQWRTIDGVLWSIESSFYANIMWVLFGLGWGMVLLSSFLINHFNLFGLQQVYQNFRGQPVPEAPFVKPLFYRMVRHPLMTGFFIALWATPVMSYGHLLFSTVMSIYIFIGVFYEERDLVAAIGDDYMEYKKQVPKFFPAGPKG